MRVGLVIEQFDPRRGGVEQWTAQFAAGLLERRHEVHVLAGRFSSETLVMPLVAHTLPPVGSRVGFAEAAQRRLRALSLDVVHDTGAGWCCDVFQPHGGSRCAVARQNLLLLPRPMRSLKRVANGLLPRYRQFDALSARQYADDGRLVLALSRMVADDFVRYHDVPPERIRLVYNGVDTERFAPEHRARYRETVRRRLGVPRESLLLLIVAHNFRLKGVPTLLRAMARWNHSRDPLHLVVVGGKRVGRHLRMARWLGVQRRVAFVGRVADTVPFYSAADLYVHPTFYDPCSLVVLEALASGLPVVTSRQNGAAELLTEGLEGYIVDDPADADALLGRLRPLLERVVRERMGRASRRLALEHTFQHNVDQILAVYEEVLQKRRHAATAPMFPVRLPFVCRKTGVEMQPERRPHRERKSGVPS